MIEGTVKWFSNAKGYGFIELSTGKEVFVHYSAIETEGYRSLSEGQKVAFELEQGPKGEHATQVRIEDAVQDFVESLPEAALMQTAA